jgi:hypothetical protein
MHPPELRWIMNDPVQRRSFRRSDNDTSARSSAEAPKDEPTAAHLLDARCTLL